MLWSAVPPSVPGEEHSLSHRGFSLQLEVQCPPGTTIGYVTQTWHPFTPKFSIQTVERETVLRVLGPCFACSCGGDVNFEVCAGRLVRGGLPHVPLPPGWKWERAVCTCSEALCPLRHFGQAKLASFWGRLRLLSLSFPKAAPFLLVPSRTRATSSRDWRLCARLCVLRPASRALGWPLSSQSPLALRGAPLAAAP